MIIIRQNLDFSKSSSHFLSITSYLLKCFSKFIFFDSQTIDDLYENLEDYNPTKKRKVLIVFDYMTADIKNNDKLSPIVIELFLRRRRLHTSHVFILQPYFKVSITIRLSVKHFIIKIPNRRDLQQIPSKHLFGVSRFHEALGRFYERSVFIFTQRHNFTLPSDN